MRKRYEELTEKDFPDAPPEKRLFAAAITRHCLDLDSPRAHERRDALRFINGHNLEVFCDLIGWDAEFVRSQLRKEGKLPCQED